MTYQKLFSVNVLTFYVQQAADIMYLDVAQVQTCTLRQLRKTLFPPLSKLHLPVLSVSFTQSKNMGLILDLLLPLVPTSKPIISDHTLSFNTGL